LCDHLNISITNRHRARGDAYATSMLFNYLLSINTSRCELNSLSGMKLKDLHPNLDPEIIEKLPEETGIY
jgi:DNA polymerase-3 subunit epsilon